MCKGLEWLTRRPIAHRGFHDVARGIVENTRTAFDRAISADYAIECDLQMSGDGEAMVFHDPTLERLTLAEGPVISRSAAELQHIQFRNGDDRIQSLDQLLQQTDASVPLVIELKSLWDGNCALAERVSTVIDGYAGPLAVMSFDPRLMLRFKDISPETPRGLVRDLFLEREWPELNAVTLDDVRQTRHLAEVAPDFLSVGLNALNSRWSQNFRATGRPVICWTVRSARAAQESLRYCDQITFEGYAA